MFHCSCSRINITTKFPLTNTPFPLSNKETFSASFPFHPRNNRKLSEGQRIEQSAVEQRMESLTLQVRHIYWQEEKIFFVCSDYIYVYIYVSYMLQNR